MHNLKEIRFNLKNFENKIKQRNSDIDIKALQNLDSENRNLIQKKEKLEQEKKIISKSKLFIFPCSEITLFELSSLPTGTSSNARLGN